MAIKYTANVIRQIKNGGTTYDLQDATLKPFVEQLLSDVASIKGVYTEEQANAHNATLDGALPNTGEGTFTAAQAEAYNNAITGAAVQENDPITPEQANLYNGTLQGAVEAGDERNDDSATSVKSLSEDLTTLEGRVTTLEGDVDTLEANVEEHARVTAASLTELDSRVDAIEAVNVTTQKMDAWDAKYDKPSTGIPASDLASAVQTSLGKADTSVQTVAVAGGTNNGTIKLTVNGTATDNIAVTGLGSAAYTASTAYDAAGAATSAENAAKAYADGLASNYDAAGAAAAVLGTSGDAASTNTVYGAKAYADSLAANYVLATEKGTADGVATLDSNGKVPSSQLPSYVDDVLEFANQAAFPAEGEAGKIYVDLSNNTTYRWSGSAYTQIKGDLVIGTTTNTAADGGIVNTHVTDTDIHVTTANKAAWNAKYDLPTGGIPKTDLASDVQTSLGKADTSVQTVVEGATNGTIAVNGTDVAVHGLGSAAYTASTAYDAAGAAAAAQTAAEADATSKANAAQAAAISAAATDATTKADAAQAAAISAAATDAATKANAAEANAKSYADTKVGTIPSGYSDVISYVDAKTATSVTNGVLEL